MSRVAGVAVAAGFVLVAIAGAVWMMPTDEPIAPQVEPAPVLPAPIPVPTPIARRLTEANRIAFETGRTRRDDVEKVRLADLEDGKEIHRQAVMEIRNKALQPCAPRPSLRGENQTRRIEVDYVLQATGIVELQVRGVDEAREEVDVPASFLDCIGNRLGDVEGPGVAGELHHRFVFAYTSAG